MDLNNGVQIALAQTMELPDFSGLPPFAQGIMYTVAAIALGLSIIIPRVGWLFGKKEQGKPENGNPTVAAVVVDNTALNNHTAALIKVADEVGELRTELHIIRELGIKIRRAGS